MPLITTTPFRGSFFSQIQRIIDPLGAVNDFAGRSVAISGDGSTVVVGAFGNDTGRALVYILSGSTYILQDTLTPSNNQFLQEFGQYVEISTDGNYIIVGADAYDGANNNEGRGYVYHRAGGSPTWVEQQILVASDAAISDALGPCSISGDGDVIVMGAQNQNAGASNSGAAYVWTRSGSTWTEVIKLVDPSPTVDGRMGINVGVSRDGSTIIVGVYALSTGTLGKALVFTSPGWGNQATLTGADVTSTDDFGIYVELSADGDVALIGSYHDDVGGFADAGSAYVFNRTGASWSETQKLTASDGALNDRFGTTLDINDNGDQVLISGYLRDKGGQIDNGSAYIFKLKAGTWTENQMLLPADTFAGKKFGFGLSATADFRTLAIGALGDTIDAKSNYGSVYIFK
jgi:hypothetical protein